MIFVPLPRRVGLTAKPFLPYRKGRINERFFQFKLALFVQACSQQTERLF